MDNYLKQITEHHWEVINKINDSDKYCYVTRKRLFKECKFIINNIRMDKSEKYKNELLKRMSNDINEVFEKYRSKYGIEIERVSLDLKKNE